MKNKVLIVNALVFLFVAVASAQLPNTVVELETFVTPTLEYLQNTMAVYFTDGIFDNVNIKIYDRLDNNSFTQYNGQNITELLKNKAYNANRSTVLFVSGWMMSPTAESSALIIDAFLRYQNCNMLVLDWSEHSVGLYTLVMFRMSLMSRQYGKYLVKLFNAGLDDKTFHCVGHSFGAHSCGILGREVQANSNNVFKFSHITGLDPAGPDFFPRPLYEQPLGVNDATFVDTIHTDTFFIGTNVPLGHVTFFPNFNATQPGCPVYNSESITDIANNMCSHFYAILYYAQTLNPQFTTIFPSVLCLDCKNFDKGYCKNNRINYMGADVNSNIQGTFFIKTKSSLAYYDGQKLFDWILNRVGNRVQLFTLLIFLYLV